MRSVSGPLCKEGVGERRRDRNEVKEKEREIESGNEIERYG